MNYFDTFTKILGKIIVATGFEWLPKVQKSPNLVTLVTSDTSMLFIERWRHVDPDMTGLSKQPLPLQVVVVGVGRKITRPRFFDESEWIQ